MSSRIFRAALLAAFILTTAAAYAQVNLSSGLVAQYRLAGNATDTGSQAQNGTVFGSVTFPTTVAGKFNPVASDTTGYIDAPPALNRDTSFTVSAWVKPTYLDPNANNPGQIVFERSSTGSDVCGVNSSGNFGATFYNGQWSFEAATLSGSTCTLRRIFAPSPATLNAWSHVLGIYDKTAGLQSLYVNGLLQVQVSAGNNLRTVANARLKISRNAPTANQPFHGDLSDIRIYDRVVTANEIAALAAMTPQVPVEPNPGPVSYYPFNGNANDSGSNGNTGTVAGTAAFTGGAYLTLNPLATDETGWMDAAPPINRDTSMSFALWLRSTSGTGSRSVFYERRADRSDACGANSAGNFAMEIYTGEKFTFATSTIAGGVCTWSRTLSQTSVVANQWYHVSGTYDKATGARRLYVNGSLETSTTVGNQLRTDANARLQVSRNNSASPYLGIHGDIDDLRFYDRALTASEVASLAGARPGSSNGTCGTADKVAVATAPTANLCATGTANPATLTGPGPWTWTCNGSGGGTNAVCSAPLIGVPLTALGIGPYKILPGQTASILPVPSNAALATCTSNNTSIATVAGRVVTGVNRGEAIITCDGKSIELQVRRPWVLNVNPSSAAPFTLNEFAITGEDLDMVAEVELDGCVGKMTEKPGTYTLTETFNPDPIVRYFRCLPTQGGSKQLRFKALKGTQNFADWQTAPTAIQPSFPGCAVIPPSGCTVTVAVPGTIVPISSKLSVFAELRDNSRYGRGGQMLWNELATPLLLEIQDRLKREGLDVSISQELVNARNNAMEQVRQITRQQLEDAIGSADGFTWATWWRSPIKVIGGSLAVMGEYTPADWAQLSTAVAINGALAVSDAVGVGNAIDAARFAKKSGTQIAKLNVRSAEMLRSGDPLLIKAAQRMAASNAFNIALQGASAGVEIWSASEKESFKATVQEFSKIGASSGLSALVGWLSAGAVPSQMTDLVRSGIIDFTAATAVDASAAIAGSGWSAASKQAIFDSAKDAAIGAIPIVGSWVDTYKVGARIADRAAQNAPMFVRADEITDWSKFQQDELTRQYLALKLALMFNEADKLLGRTNLREKLPTIAFGLPSQWVAQSGSIQRVVTITHGWNSEASSWPDALVQRMCTRIGGTRQTEVAAADKTIVGVSSWCMQNGWLVASFNWHPDAAVDAFKDIAAEGVGRGPWSALANAERHGADFGKDLAGIGIAPSLVHAIGHSAGSGFVEKFTTALKAARPSARIHSTFLDAFCPDADACEYGKSADWAEQYVDRRTIGDVLLGRLTNSTLANAYTFDVTGLDPVVDYPGEVDAVAFHAFPYKTYIQSASTPPLDTAWGIVRTTIVGAPLNALYGGLTSVTPIDQWIAQRKNAYPNGFRCSLASTTDSATVATCPVGGLSRYESTTQNAVSFAPGSSSSYCGDSATAVVTTGVGTTASTCPPSVQSLALLSKASTVSAAALTAGVGSARTEVTTTQQANLLSLTYRFTSGSSSVMARFFINDQLVHIARMSDSGTTSTTVSNLPISLLPAGAHLLQVVLNTDSTDVANVQITQIQFSMRTAIIDGACGRQHGLASSAMPTDLCTSGKPSAVMDASGSWTWTCGAQGAGATIAACAATKPVCRLDIDGDGVTDAATDGVILLRHLLGFKGSALVAGLTLSGPRSAFQRIEEFLAPTSAFDVFGRSTPGAVPATIDGVVLQRIMRQVGDASLLAGVTVPVGTATTAPDVRARVLSRCM